MAPILSTRNLVKTFRGFNAVNRVDLDVTQDSVHALVGPNGAGKTTLFHLLTGFHKPSGGTITANGVDVTGLAPERIARLGLARSFQITKLFAQLTPRQHLELALAASSGLGWRFWRPLSTLRRYDDRVDELLEQVGLTEQAEEAADALSYGRKRALELALALALEPKILLLDEPTAGMGTEDVDRTVELIERVRAGRTVILVEHNMNVVGRLADRVTVLQHGEVLVEGAYADIRKDPRVVAAYLGDPDARD